MTIARTTLLVIVLIVAASFATADTITSTPAGGHWSLATTWVDGLVPGDYDDVILVGPVMVTGTEACNSLIVEVSGSVSGGFSGPNNTLQVAGSVTNGGTIVDSIAPFFLEVGGDLYNAGSWTNQKTVLTGTADRTLTHPPGLGLVTNLEFGPGAAGDLILNKPFEVTGNVDMTGGRLVLGPESPFYLNMGRFRGELAAGGNEMHFISWSYLEQATLDDVVLVGEVEATFSVEFTTRVTVQDTLRNGSGGGGATIHGDLINNGLITNHQYGFIVFLYGNLENNGNIRNSQIEFKGDAVHHISMSPESVISANLFLPEFDARTLVADTPVHFADGLGLGVGTLVLEPGSSLRFTDFGGLGSGIVEANGNTISIDGSGSLGGVTVDRGVIANQVAVSFDLLFTNGLTVTGTMTGWQWAAAEVTVEGLLVNEGEIRDGDHPVSVTAMNDVLNTGSFHNSEVILAGTTDQSVGAGPGIAVASFILESGLSAGYYQWYRDGAPLFGEDASRLVLAGVDSEDYGTYHCVGDGQTSRSIFIAETFATSDVPGAAAFVSLEQNHPNPFNPATEIAFNLNRSGPVSLVVFDLAGRRVADLVDREMGPGRHQVTWEPRDLASGTYVFRLQADGAVMTRKGLLVK